MSLSRRFRPRPLVRAVVPVAVLGLTVALTAIPANAVYVPPPATAKIATANPADVTPHVQNGSVRAFAQIGSTVYAGGSFTGVKVPGAASWTAVTHLFAYDATTGALRTAFKPVLDNALQTLAVTPDGNQSVGGNFGTRNAFYPEFALICWASRRLGRPVRIGDHDAVYARTFADAAAAVGPDAGAWLMSALLGGYVPRAR